MFEIVRKSENSDKFHKKALTIATLKSVRKSEKSGSHASLKTSLSGPGICLH